MWSLLISGLGLGLIDCLNPFTISTQVVLQPFVKKNRHVLYYIFGTYLSYLIGGLFIYLGIDRLLADWWREFMAAHSVLVYSLEIALGAGLMIAGAASLFRHLTKVHSKQSNEAKPPKSVHPVFLFFFGASNTIGDLPTAFPYLIFIARVVDAKLSVFAVVLLLALYCCVYTMPLMILYILYRWNQSRLEYLVETIRNRIAALASWVTIVCVAGLGVFLTIHGCLSLTG